VEELAELGDAGVGARHAWIVENHPGLLFPFSGRQPGGPENGKINPG
jgi:hypothetical protein